MQNDTKLNKEQIAILEHTLKNGRYCGDSEDMNELCKKGLMKYIGRLTMIPDGYYRITREGKNAI
ncbi:MAG: hypothetical protein ACTSVV_10725 [Promethearchaeota archaeon]